ncbi:SLC13 family permease [Cucumibacter marinus]|uniref:SLC13 family permease n=1 Tax=Cucumibacter marinus TaxID=1121252 RepID=UPI0009DC3078|nr:SLC13 family permease [Cucumibacter marinus]
MLAAWLSFAVIFVAIILFATERVAMEVSALGAIVALLLIGAASPDAGLTPEALLAGFANPALISILALIVMGQGLMHTDALGPFTANLERLWPRQVGRVMILVLIAAGIISAVINNTPVVVMFIPVLAAVAARRRVSTRKIMMPLSYISILGGMTTMIGSSTNLLAAGVARDSGVEGLDFFAFTVPGLAMASVGALYVLFVMPKLLPSAGESADDSAPSRNLQFISEVRLTPGHPLIGQSSVAGMFPALTTMTLRAVRRYGINHVPPFEDLTLQAGDTLILAATRDRLTEALKEWRAFDNPDEIAGGTDERRPEIVMCEALVPPGSRLINNGVNQAGFMAQHGCLILGVERRSRMPRQALSEIRLEAGDVLLLAGNPKQVKRLRGLQDLVVFEWSTSEVQSNRYAQRALGIFALTVAAIATGFVPTVIAAVTGAFAMIAAGCLNIRQAGRAVDRRIVMLVGSAIAMATALEVTGGAELVASLAVSGLGDVPPAFVMGGIFLVVALLTNVLSNNATAVLFTPIAISAAKSLGVDPLPFVVAVILGANASFATPIGYQTNLLVMSPGHYQFKHFLVAGLPLVFLVWIVFCVVAPWWYGV